MSRKFVVAWAALMALAVVPSLAAANNAGGLGAVVCVNLGVLLALTITPVETLIDAVRTYLPGGGDDAG